MKVCITEGPGPTSNTTRTTTTVTTTTTTGYANTIQDLNYAYDNVGNITRITDNATSTGTGRNGGGQRP